MTATTSKPKRETWLDWLPSDAPDPLELITRQELARRVSDRGFDVTNEKIGYWEKQGVLPLPVRRWHEGATRALYPSWMEDVVIRAIGLRERGESTSGIRQSTRDLTVTLGSKKQLDVTEVFKAEDVNRAAREYAAFHNKTNAEKITSIHVEFRGENGGSIIGWTFSIPDK